MWFLRCEPTDIQTDTLIAILRTRIETEEKILQLDVWLQNVVADGDGSAETAMKTRVNGVIPTLCDVVQTSKSPVSSPDGKPSLKSVPDQTPKQGLH